MLRTNFEQHYYYYDFDRTFRQQCLKVPEQDSSGLNKFTCFTDIRSNMLCCRRASKDLRGSERRTVWRSLKEP